MLKVSSSGLRAVYMMGVDVGEYFLVVLTEAPGWEEEMSGSRNAGLRDGSEQSRAIITDDIPPLFVLQRGGCLEAVGNRIVDLNGLLGEKKVFLRQWRKMLS